MSTERMTIWHDPLELDQPDPPAVQVTVTDNPITAVLYHPDGTILLEIHERPTTIGFRR